MKVRVSLSEAEARALILGAELAARTGKVRTRPLRSLRTGAVTLQDAVAQLALRGERRRRLEGSRASLRAAQNRIEDAIALVEKAKSELQS